MSPMAGISEKRAKVANRQNQQEIEKNRATPHHENEPESALPKLKKPSDQNEILNMSVHSQCVLWADVPAVNLFLFIDNKTSSCSLTPEQKQLAIL